MTSWSISGIESGWLLMKSEERLVERCLLEAASQYGWDTYFDPMSDPFGLLTTPEPEVEVKTKFSIRGRFFKPRKCRTNDTYEGGYTDGYTAGVESMCRSLSFLVIYEWDDRLSRNKILEFLKYREGLVTDDVG